MITWEDDVEVHALHKQGWSISAIARHAPIGHTGGDRPAPSLTGYDHLLSGAAL
jgi:hypothetical protein